MIVNVLTALYRKCTTLLRANKTTKGHIQFLAKTSKKKTAIEHLKQNCV